MEKITTEVKRQWYMTIGEHFGFLNLCNFNSRTGILVIRFAGTSFIWDPLNDQLQAVSLANKMGIELNVSEEKNAEGKYLIIAKYGKSTWASSAKTVEAQYEFLRRLILVATMDIITLKLTGKKDDAEASRG